MIHLSWEEKTHVNGIRYATLRMIAKATSGLWTQGLKLVVTIPKALVFVATDLSGVKLKPAAYAFSTLYASFPACERKVPSSSLNPMIKCNGAYKIPTRNCVIWIEVRSFLSFNGTDNRSAVAA